jgi:hypothetical protein
MGCLDNFAFAKKTGGKLVGAAGEAKNPCYPAEWIKSESAMFARFDLKAFRP